MAETPTETATFGGFNLQVSPEIRGPVEAFLDTIPLWEVWGCCLKFDHYEILLMLEKIHQKATTVTVWMDLFLNLEQKIGRFQLPLFPQLVFHTGLCRNAIGSVAPTTYNKQWSKVKEEILFAERFCWGDLWNEKRVYQKKHSYPKRIHGTIVHLPTFGLNFYGTCREIYHTWILWDMRSKEKKRCKS